MYPGTRMQDCIGMGPLNIPSANIMPTATAAVSMAQLYVERYSTTDWALRDILT